MCHCFQSFDDLTVEERKEVREEHTIEELRAELAPDELEALGIAA